MRKQLVAAALCVGIALSLSSCAPSAETTPTNAPAPSAAQPTSNNTGEVKQAIKEAMSTYFDPDSVTVMLQNNTQVISAVDPGLATSAEDATEPDGWADFVASMEALSLELPLIPGAETSALHISDTKDGQIYLTVVGGKTLYDAIKAAQPTPEPTTDTTFFILNTKTRKFHRPGCTSVKDIAPENQEISYLSAGELKGQGYKSCGNCKP